MWQSKVEPKSQGWRGRAAWRGRVPPSAGASAAVTSLFALGLQPNTDCLLCLPLSTSCPGHTHTQACAPTLLVSPYNRSPRTSLLDKVTSVVPTSQHRLRGTPCVWTTCSPKWKIKSIGHHKNTHSGYFMFNISENNASTTYTWHL